MKSILIISFLAIISSGCATILKGYEDSVRINNLSDSLQVFTKDGIEIPIVRSKVMGKTGIVNRGEIQLRVNHEHTLVLKDSNRQKVVTLYPELGFGWVVMDLVFGVLPSFYDAYTGSWTSFSDIDATFNK